jgi:biotin operon repressor
MQRLADTFGVSRPAVARRMQELAIFVKLGR